MGNERNSATTTTTQNNIASPSPRQDDIGVDDEDGNNLLRLDEEQQASLDENTEQALEERHEIVPEERNEPGDSIFPFGGGEDNVNIFARTSSTEPSSPISISNSEEGELIDGDMKEGGDGPEVAKSNKILQQDDTAGRGNNEHHHQHHDYFGPF